MEIIKNLRGQLQNLADEEYRSFNANLIPGESKMIGVRLPVLRKLARETARVYGFAYLDEAAGDLGSDSLHEELMLYGMVIGCMKMDREERTLRMESFIPLIRNWALCDCFVSSCKFMAQDSDFWFHYLQRYLNSVKEYELRFMVVSLLSYFTDEEHIDAILSCCGKIRHDGYYVKMAVAWAVSVSYVKFPEKTREFLSDNQMDDFTQNKSIQKIRESFRVSRDEKDSLILLKRTP